ncbi:peptidoglycan-binding domain-containing protein [Streptomyces ipomoeae]|uniref:peptidoglycan-binding domain-containing protein n=1 Tax=Streptomyces ipomoeae TaxID=103232 RepID=UPI00114612DE|nr:Tat pathway signal protein [Streptomyces ipomoeae]MDX2939533.1 Tat pathway signal protein [Streptomyces ipomoeae]TQE27963.1 Tat pathway signal protein [Streptomyces ipomoeae]
MSRRKRLRGAAAVISAAVLTMMGLSASPASAKISDGWVRGYDTFKGDWGDEGDLSRTSPFANSNATCLWQRILWAEGASAVGYDNKLFEKGHIDGSYGYRTHYTTRSLQSRWGLGNDGIAGNDTWGRADDNLVKISGSTADGEMLYLRYDGKEHSFSVQRNTEGKYLFPDGAGNWRQAGYEYLTCS